MLVNKKDGNPYINDHKLINIKKSLRIIKLSLLNFYYSPLSSSNDEKNELQKLIFFSALDEKRKRFLRRLAKITF
jgi:hypothetical protein